jgi:ubiquinone/menaquinone biosynthesis C-methylase UbiE
MLQLIEKLKQNAQVLDSFDKLGGFVRNIDINGLEFSHLIPQIVDRDNYARNILMMHPIEVGLLHWPAGVESAVHHHQGFYGYVIVLEGELDNIEYGFENDQLTEKLGVRGRKGGILPETDGVIHKLANPSATKAAVTLHIYYPPLESFEGMKIFDLENKKIAILSAEAKTASWSEPTASYSSIQENAFSYKSRLEQQSSHYVYPVLPKPTDEEIYAMLGDYYNEQAQEYDDFDATHAKRSAYVAALNKIIAEDFIQNNGLEKMLALACGTGRRALDIQQLSNKNYHIVGVDLSPEMAEMATQNGLEAFNCRWLKCDLPYRDFDAATFLYAFGHICTMQERKEALQKIHKHLKTGAALYFDVFNLQDSNEWGPQATEIFTTLQLDNMGYQLGDIFYKKTGGDAIAYLHYFDKTELNQLLTDCGYRVEWIKHIGYSYKPGEELTEAEGGKLFIKAVKV